jgi:FtsP/CotA-like multicopper oxidase with cupredoxin domain
VVAYDKEIEIAPGVFFPAWTYNGQVPGPTIRCNEGDRLRIQFSNAGTHPHTIHFHGIHSAFMDGVTGIGRGDIQPGESFTYEFDAFPFGCHLYHCHSTPLKRHIHKGLYGAFIINPDPRRQGDRARARHPDFAESREWQELVMLMNAFDTTFDNENEVYAVNSVAFHYMKHPIRVERDRPVRVYLINVTEFDPINSFHLHANFFDYYDHGTTLEPTLRTVDTVMQCQGQRGILELSFKGFEPGLYMFHPHQTEFVELGWMSAFEVV